MSTQCKKHPVTDKLKPLTLFSEMFFFLKNLDAKMGAEGDTQNSSRFREMDITGQ